ncbi:rhodanese-like domain-containing protein [Melaminivora jejuensis]|uniref:rhodanese-like domain-containing protein n=1 Tax=Melaminivora jejuensis TaxID=1267217 RepID=UPI001AE09516|nr:rhodanese-like domain-containing protein [Melaminivora jejuensis]UHJ63608.1 sulfurtransferase [Melaminivora jejuensis]
MIEQLYPNEALAWLAEHAGQRPVLLDVREAWELQQASVAPAASFEFLHIPMGSLVARLHELDPQRPVACLCHHGARSLRVAMFLAQQGFGQVANVAGGIDAWSQVCDPAVPRY